MYTTNREEILHYFNNRLSDYFQLPFQYKSPYIKDANGHTVANFTRELSEQEINNIVGLINGDENETHRLCAESGYCGEGSEICINTDAGLPEGSEPTKTLRIRGYGYLTGKSACGLGDNQAFNVMMSMSTFITLCIGTTNRK